MRYPSFVLIAAASAATHDTRRGISAPSSTLKLAAVDAAAAFVPSHYSSIVRNRLPPNLAPSTSSGSAGEVRRGESHGERAGARYYADINVIGAANPNKFGSGGSSGSRSGGGGGSPASVLHSSIIDAPRTERTASDDDGDDGDDSDDKYGNITSGDKVQKRSEEEARLEAEAEAFLERMFARSSTPSVSADNHKINGSKQSDDERSENANHDEVPKRLPKDEETDLEVAAEWQNDQIENAARVVRTMNAASAVAAVAEVAEVEEKQQKNGEEVGLGMEMRQTIAAAAAAAAAVSDERDEKDVVVHDEIVAASAAAATGTTGTTSGSDGFAFQQARLARQLSQRRATVAEDILAKEEAVNQKAEQVREDSASSDYAFQQARLARQLSQPRSVVAKDMLAQEEDAVSQVPVQHDEKGGAYDDYAFQKVRLARQLSQPHVVVDLPAEAESAFAAAADEEAVHQQVRQDHEEYDVSASNDYAFQQARLARQLSQPRIVVAEKDAVPQQVLQQQDQKDSATINYTFQQARLARQLSQPSIVNGIATEAVQTPTLDDIAAEPMTDTSSEKDEYMKNEARKMRFRQIEEWAAEGVRKASEAAEKALAERAVATEKMVADRDAAMQEIQEAVAVSAQTAASEHAIPAAAAENDDEEDNAVPIDVPEAIIDDARWDVEEDVVSPTSSVDKKEPEAEPLKRRSATYVLKPTLEKPKKPSFWRSITPAEITSSLLKTIAPERGLLQYADDSELEIARCATYHLARATYDTGRAAIFALSAAIESVQDPEFGITFEESRNRVSNDDPEGTGTTKSAAEICGTAIGSVGEVTGTFLTVFGENEASRLALEAAGDATHQLSSFFAACAALGLRSGVKAKIYANNYQRQRAEEQEKVEQARIKAEKQLQAKLKILASKQRLEEERIAEEQRALREIKARVDAEKQRVEEGRIAAEKKALADIRRKADAKKHMLELELVRNGLKEVIEITDSRGQEKKAKAPFFFVDQC